MFITAGLSTCIENGKYSNDLFNSIFVEKPSIIIRISKLFIIQTLLLLPGARLTKTYDVTIQRCRKSHTKIKVSKMHILRCMGSKFCVKFQRCPLKLDKKF